MSSAVSHYAYLRLHSAVTWHLFGLYLGLELSILDSPAVGLFLIKTCFIF